MKVVYQQTFKNDKVKVMVKSCVIFLSSIITEGARTLKKQLKAKKVKKLKKIYHLNKDYFLKANLAILK